MWQRFRYRVWQLGQIMRARPLPPAAHREIAVILSPAEQSLFYQFSRSDQGHSYRVMRLLQLRGEENQALLAAALLHDIGKTRVTLHWWERVVIVLAMVAGKDAAARWGQGEPYGWRKALVVKAQHPTWGAEMVQAIGGHPLTIRLIRYHQDVLAPDAAATPENNLLRSLQWADDQS